MGKRFILFNTLLLFFVAILTLAQDDPTVYVTRTGYKYHRADCRYLKSSIPMKLSEAVKTYRACAVCKPPIPGVQSTHSNESVKPSEPAKIENSTSTPTPESQIGTTPTGKTIYTGPRGGRYHYSKSGKKVYERKKH